MTDSDWLEETQTEKPLLGMQERKQEKTVSCVWDATMWRRPKILASILGELYEEVPHPLRSREDGTSEQAGIRTRTENEKDNI